MFHPQGPTFLELARQALSSTERGYDLLASKFDYTPFRTPNEIIEVVWTPRPELLGVLIVANDPIVPWGEQDVRRQIVEHIENGRQMPQEPREAVGQASGIKPRPIASERHPRPIGTTMRPRSTLTA